MSDRDAPPPSGSLAPLLLATAAITLTAVGLALGTNESWLVGLWWVIAAFAGLVTFVGVLVALEQGLTGPDTAWIRSWLRDLGNQDEHPLGRCLACHETVFASRNYQRCLDCQAPFHARCWSGRCPDCLPLCPDCNQAMEVGDVLAMCGGCSTTQHVDCFRTLGCAVCRAAGLEISVTAAPETGSSRCPFCRDDVRGPEGRLCPGCATLYHGACWEEGGGCGTLGCREAQQRKPERARP